MIIQGTAEQRVVSYVMDRYDELKTARRDKELVWLDCVKAYMSDFAPIWDEQAKVHRRSKRFIALSFDAVESLNSQLLSAMFIGNNWLQIEASTPGKLQANDVSANEIKHVLISQMGHMEFKRQFSILLKQLQVTGNAPYTVGWGKERVTDYPAYMRAMQKWRGVYGAQYQLYKSEMMRWQLAAREAAQGGQMPPPRPSVVLPDPPSVSKEVAYSGPTFEVDDIFNFVIDPFSPDQRNALRIKRSFTSKSVLRRLAEKNKDGYSVYDNIDEIQETDRRGTDNDDWEVERYRAFGLKIPEASQIEIHEAWGTMDIPGTIAGETDSYVSFNATIADGKHLIRFEPTFLWSGKSPVQLATFRDVPGQVYGIGQLEMGLGLQDIINVRANQVVDAAAYVINPEHKVRDDGIIDLNEKSAPGKLRIMGDPQTNMVPLEKNFTGLQLGMSELDQLKAEFQGITKSQSPVSASRKESATRASLGAGAINTDVAKVAEHIERTCLNEIIYLFIELNAQYKTEPEVVRVLEKGTATFPTVSPESWRQRLVAKVMGSQHVLDKEERIQNLMMFMQVVLGNPLLVSGVKPLELIKKVYGEFGFNDEDTIFRGEADAEQIFQEMIRLGLIGNGGNQGAGSAVGGDGQGSSANRIPDNSGEVGTDQTGQVQSGVPTANPEDRGNAPGGNPFSAVG